MKIKKFTGILCVGALAAVCAFSLAACSEGTATVEYTLGEDGAHYVVSGVKGSKRALMEYDILPEYVGEDGKALPVTEIGYEAFINCSSLYSINIPDSIVTINPRAFKSCALTKVTIPDSVTTIGYAAFGMCEALEEVVISKSVTTMERFAFGYCTHLKTIVIEEGLTELDIGVFINKVQMSSGQFYPNTCLETVYIPASVKRIYYNALEGNTLTTLNYGGSQEQWDELYFYKTEKAEGEETAHEVRVKKEEVLPATTNIVYNAHYQKD